MVKMKSEVQDEFHVSYEVARHGWRHLNISIGFQVLSFVDSDIYAVGGPEALLDICESLLRNEATDTPFYDEPGGVVLQLEPIKKQRHLMHFRAFDIGNKIGEYERTDLQNPLFDILVKRKQLFTNLILELWRGMLLSQEPSYQKYRSNFPAERLMMLNVKWNASNLGPSCLFQADN